jgi:formylglycine-generating enzyme required for sulfatase activity
MPSALPNTLSALLLAASTASAAITIPTVSVGDAGNADDGTGYGGVAYNYEIGTHEVTNSQYTAFLNAVAKTDTHSLYNENMGSDIDDGGINQSGTSGSFNYSVKSGFGNKPVNYVSFWDSARFANWLTNGQGSGDTETGAYDLTDSTAITNNTVTRGSWYDEATGNTSSETVFAVASEDEWYKAAYYDGDGDLYYDYPTQSDTAPTAEGPPGGTNSANYDKVVGSVTDVGAYPDSGSHYGTFDQGGNVAEWNDEKIISDGMMGSSSNRGLRGDNFLGGGGTMKSSIRGSTDPTGEFSFIGFRVSSLAAIPEPSSYGAIFGIVGLAAAVFFRRRRRRE